MPKKKPLEIPKEFVEQVLALIANESEEGRKKIVTIARRAEEKYQRPVKSWLMGWFYQYTRVRGEKVEQSINVMENFPDAYTRLQEFKIMISEGKWEVGSYNYLLFLELIDSMPDYAPLAEPFLYSFVLELKDLVIEEINNFMAQYDSVVEAIKAREIEKEAMRQKECQALANVVILNNLDAAKEESKQNDKTVFFFDFKNEQWYHSWIANGEICPLTPSIELIKKLATLKEMNFKQLEEADLKGVRKECLKVRAQSLSKIQLLINPEDKSHTSLTNEDLIADGATSTFVLRHTESEVSLWWINSIGVPNKISITNYPKLESLLATHKAPFNEVDNLQLKAYLSHVKTTQSFSASKLEQMNGMLEKVLKKHTQGADKKTSITPGKLDLSLFSAVKEHLEDRVKKISKTPTLALSPESKSQTSPKKLQPERYAIFSQLSTFWQQDKMAEAAEEVNQTPRIS